MNKTELENAIKNGESVWYIVNNGLAEIDLGCNFHEIKDNELLTWYDKYSKDYYTHRTKLEDLFKTKAEAEHYLHHANITRTEQLPFLTWEEFKGGKEVIFKGNNDKGYALVYNKGLNKIDLFNTDGVIWGIVESWQPTEENFYKAYDECVKLFKGE